LNIYRNFCNSYNAMLKKNAHILVVSLLLISTSGISMTRHYCGNTLKSVSISGTSHSCCDGVCNKCHNKYSYNKVNDEFTDTSASIFDFKADTHISFAIVNFNFSDQLISSALLPYYDLRKFLYLKAGDSPAFICNFRC
jgi:hypothetical protein